MSVGGTMRDPAKTQPTLRPTPRPRPKTQSMKLKPYEETGLPTYDVDLEAPPDTRWNHVAQKEAKNIGRLLDDVVELCTERASSFPLVFRPLVIAAGKGLAILGGRLVDMIAACFGKEYVAEIRSIAKHADQPL
ncbi:MAG: hypothetical protein FJ286_11235, partial [Planctomycetes bacterium]|nr:hypothetical protein [Planctomycetota bacterium]